MTQVNMKPADELLMIRQRVKELKAREEELKAAMKSGEADTDGDFAIVRIIKSEQSRFDRKAAEVELGDLSRFCKQVEVVRFSVDELVMPEDAA